MKVRVEGLTSFEVRDGCIPTIEFGEKSVDFTLTREASVELHGITVKRRGHEDVSIGLNSNWLFLEPRFAKVFWSCTPIDTHLAVLPLGDGDTEFIVKYKHLLLVYNSRLAKIDIKFTLVE